METRTQPISWSSSPAVGSPSWISTKITSHSWSILRSVEQAPPSATASPLSAMPAQVPTCSRPGPAAAPPGAAATTSASSLSLQTTTARAKRPSRSSSAKPSRHSLRNPGIIAPADSCESCFLVHPVNQFTLHGQPRTSSQTLHGTAASRLSPSLRQ